MARSCFRSKPSNRTNSLGVFSKRIKREFLLREFEFLTARQVLGDNENAIRRFKQALVTVNGIFETHGALRDSKNRGLLSALTFYELDAPLKVPDFVRWVIENNLQLIAEPSATDLIAIFDRVLESKKRTIFVSMPLGKAKADDHYAIIERVCREVSQSHQLKPPLRVKRVDLDSDGTSGDIASKILRMLNECGLLIGNLTHCNPNVYHEVGFVMGKAMAAGTEPANMLLFLDESVSEKEKIVAFNLRGIKQLRFTKPELEFAPALRENLEKFFRLRP